MIIQSPLQWRWLRCVRSSFGFWVKLWIIMIMYVRYYSTCLTFWQCIDFASDVRVVWEAPSDSDSRNAIFSAFGRDAKPRWQQRLHECGSHLRCQSSRTSTKLWRCSDHLVRDSASVCLTVFFMPASHTRLSYAPVTKLSFSLSVLIDFFFSIFVHLCFF